MFLWSGADRIGQSVLQFLVSILLARLLTPDDFGLMGSVMLFSAIAYVFVDCGMGKALARERGADDRHFTTILLANSALAILFYAIAYISAPMIAVAMGITQLSAIIRILFLSLFFNALYIVPHTRLQMAFRFDVIAAVNLLSCAVSVATAMVAAFNGSGVWALVAQQMTYHASRAVGFNIVAPRWHIAKPSWNILRDTLRFSLPIAFSGLLNAVFSNIYLFVIARFFPLYQAGQYTHAHKQADTASFSLMAILESTTYNLLASLRHDDERFSAILGTLLRRANLFMMPVLVLLAVIARHACLLLFGEQWLPSVPYFRLLCVAFVPSALSLLITNALNVKGLSRLTFTLELLRKFLIALAVVIGIPLGIRALLWGYVVAAYVGCLIQMIALHYRAGYSFKQQIIDIAPAVLLAMSVASLLLVVP